MMLIAALSCNGDEDNDDDVKDSGDKDEDVKDGGEPDGLALLHSDVLLLPLAVSCGQGKEHHLKKFLLFTVSLKGE